MGSDLKVGARNVSVRWIPKEVISEERLALLTACKHLERGCLDGEIRFAAIPVAVDVHAQDQDRLAVDCQWNSVVFLGDVEPSTING
jgi:hypothetical protein